MRFVGDFHIHSKYARATSKDMNLENLDKWAKIKGIKVISCGDFTHPAWFAELKEKLEPAEQGLYKLRGSNIGTRFIVTTEISCIYKEKDQVRKVHLLLFAPSLEAAENINIQLGLRGNLKSDGRPIIGINAKEVVKIALDASPDCMVVPAHCLLPGAVVHTQDNLVKKIEEIQEGDFVYTHQNRWRKVIKNIVHSHKGVVYRIKPYYFREGLTATSEHPFYALKTQKHCEYKHGFCHPNCSGRSHCCKKHFATKSNFIPQWVQAKDLEKSDVLIYPRFTRTQDCDYIAIQDFATSPVFFEHMIDQRLENSSDSNASVLTMKSSRTRMVPASISVSKEFCRLVGYYLAEGSEGRDLISFTFAQHEEKYLSDVRFLMKDIFSLQPSAERMKEGSNELIYYSKILKAFFGGFCYDISSKEHRAHTKALPGWMLELPLEKQSEIVRGWWRGDAGYTSSRMLMNQMKIMFLRLGVIPSVYVDKKEDHNARNHHDYDGRRIEARHDNYILNRISVFEDSYELFKSFEISRRQRLL
jgi:PHP family Zn ribbon phosphoesterase